MHSARPPPQTSANDIFGTLAAYANGPGLERAIFVGLADDTCASQRREESSLVLVSNRPKASVDVFWHWTVKSNNEIQPAGNGKVAV